MVFWRPHKHQRTESLYTQALNAVVHGDYSTAITLLRRVVKQDTEHVDAYLQLGDILREQGNPQQALKIHQSLTVRPNLSERLQRDIHKSLALDYHKLNQFTKAEDEAKRLLKLDHRNQWAVEFLLNIAVQERKWKAAAKHANTLQKFRNQRDPVQLATFQVYEGLEELEQGDRKGAEAHFKQALKLAPKFGLPYKHLGDLYAENRELVKAIEMWEQFALLDSARAPQVFSKIESALFDLGRFSEVEKFYERMLKKDAGHLDATVRLANVLEEKGQHEQALHLIEDALVRHSDSIIVKLMKLKLSLHQAPPHELAHQIDELMESLTTQERQE